MSKRMMKLAALMVPVLLSVGCATKTAPYDYSAFVASNPRSLLVLPPLNNSPDVSATYGVYAQVTHPLAEAGYYVLPVSLVDETFKQNGLTTAADIHNVAPKKLQEIFGADAGLYLTVTQYGSSYNIISSVVTVAAEAKLVDLKTGVLLWENKVIVAEDSNQGGNGGGGLLGALVKAAVTQIMNSATDRTYAVARTANQRLLAGGNLNGMLYGPRSPNYKGQGAALAHTAATAGAQPAAKPAVAATAVAKVSTAPVVAPPPNAMPGSAAPAMPVAPAPVAAVVQPAPVIAPAPRPAPVAAAPAMAVAPAPVAVDMSSATTVAPARPAVAQPVPQAAAAPAEQLSGPEQRYAEILRRAQAKHAALNPSSGWFRRDLYEWVMERKTEFVVAGQASDVALQKAINMMERN
jgi:hypothetical protein